jgi:hypothetical protein
MTTGRAVQALCRNRPDKTNFAAAGAPRCPGETDQSSKQIYTPCHACCLIVSPKVIHSLGLLPDTRARYSRAKNLDCLMLRTSVHFWCSQAQEPADHNELSISQSRCVQYALAKNVTQRFCASWFGSFRVHRWFEQRGTPLPFKILQPRLRRMHRSLWLFQNFKQKLASLRSATPGSVRRTHKPTKTRRDASCLRRESVH